MKGLTQFQREEFQQMLDLMNSLPGGSEIFSTQEFFYRIQAEKESYKHKIEGSEKGSEELLRIERGYRDRLIDLVPLAATRDSSYDGVPGFTEVANDILSLYSDKLSLLYLLAGYEKEACRRARFVVDLSGLESGFTGMGSLIYVVHSDSTVRIRHLGIVGFVEQHDLRLDRFKQCELPDCRKIYYATRLGSRTGKRTCSERCSKRVQRRKGLSAKSSDPVALGLKRERLRLKRQLRELLKVFPTDTPHPRVKTLQNEIADIEKEINDLKSVLS